MKHDWGSKQSEELQSFADQNKRREFFTATRKLYGPTNSGVRPMMGKYGDICKDRWDIRERWREHFSELLNQDTVVDPKLLDIIQQRPVETQLAEPPGLEELKSAINAMKPGEATAPDGIPAEIYKKQ